MKEKKIIYEEKTKKHMLVHTSLIFMMYATLLLSPSYLLYVNVLSGTLSIENRVLGMIAPYVALLIAGIATFLGIGAIITAISPLIFTNLKIYDDGIVIPYRSLKQAMKGEEEFISFRDMKNIYLKRINLKRNKDVSYLVFVKRNGESVWIDVKDIIDLNRLIGLLKEKIDNVHIEDV